MGDTRVDLLVKTVYIYLIKKHHKAIKINQHKYQIIV